MAAKKETAGKRRTAAAGKRDLVKAKNATFFTKRTPRGRFKSMDERGRALSADRRQTAKKATRSGYGDQGDRRRKRAA